MQKCAACNRARSLLWPKAWPFLLREGLRKRLNKLGLSCAKQGEFSLVWSNWFKFNSNSIQIESKSSCNVSVNLNGLNGCLAFRNFAILHEILQYCSFCKSGFYTLYFPPIKSSCKISAQLVEKQLRNRLFGVERFCALHNICIRQTSSLIVRTEFYAANVFVYIQSNICCRVICQFVLVKATCLILLLKMTTTILADLNVS